MSALTFEILSTELTLALSEQSDTPPDTTARCNLGRDKVMVLVEYPLDSAQAEPMASETLDWLEAHLRNQFDTTGLPEEAADLAEAGEEVPVQLFLKHRSEPKPFTMRSFIWKVDDGFDDIFGHSFDAAKATPPPATSETAEHKPIFRHPSEVLPHSNQTHNDQNQVNPLHEEQPVKESTLAPTLAMSTTELADAEQPASELLASELAVSERHNAEFQASELSEPIPSELDEEHLLLDLEPDLDLDLDPSLSSDLNTELETGMDSAELDLGNYLSSTDVSNSQAHSSGLEAPLEIEAEFLSEASSSDDFSTNLDDLATGLTYPSVTPASQTVDTGEAFDADLAAGVTGPDFSDSSSTEFSLPGEAPTIASSEFDLPTVDLPVISKPGTNPSGDFFTFEPGEADVAPTNFQTEAEEDLKSEIAFSQATPTLENDLSVEFGLSPEDAPPVVYDAGLNNTGLNNDDFDDTNQNDAGPNDIDLDDIGLNDIDINDTGLNDTSLNDTELISDPDLDSTDLGNAVPDHDPSTNEDRSADESSAEDDLHLFDLPTADESLSAFDLPADDLPADDLPADDLPAVGNQYQDTSTETIEDYLPTEELPSDDLSRGELPPEDLASGNADDLFEDPLIAEVEKASSDADDAGPPSLDLSPLAYHILADEMDDDEAQPGHDESGPSSVHQSNNQGDLSSPNYDATSYLGDEAVEADGYDPEDYDPENYDVDSAYYLEDEEYDEEPLEDVALIDDGEVERQRDQWQQQSKGNPWIFVGALGLLVLGVLGFVFTRPCSFGDRCDRIQTAQAQGDEAIGNLRIDASLESVNTSKKELESAIQSLKPIPVWSPYHEDAQAILPEYENQVEALALVTKAQEQAYKAAVDSQNPPHSVSTWNGIAADWLAATQSLEAVPAESPVRELAERKLLEYRSNRATILVRIDAESKAEVSLRQSQQAATKATNLSQSAGTLQDWEDALAAWESAVDNLSQIPQGTNAHGEAQQILPGYLKQLEEVRDRTEQERSASRELFQAKQRAADAQRAESEDGWTIAAQNWKAALSQLQDIPQGTLSHSEAQALSGLYTSALSKAESNLQIALRFQPVEPEFFAACGTTTAPKCTYSVRGGNVRLDLFQGYDSVIDQSITPPDQRTLVANANDQYVDPSNQLLRSITLLSTQAQVPIELYDAKGDFLARYRPDLNGFVREQG